MDASARDLEEMVAAGSSAERPHAHRSHAVLVAGMHRTGTSALTRVLGLLGVDLPRNLNPAEPNSNELGYWEPAPVAQANDAFLASIGSAWDNVSPIAPSVFASAKADAFADELGEILRAEYGESSLFVVKDPRLCRLVPVWVDALERFGARPSFVVTTRNPLEVAASLKARNGFSATKSCLLWLRYVLDAERDSRNFPRVFTSYERLLRDWVATTDRIARELHLFWPRSDHATNLEIEEFLSSAHRHHSFDYSELRARSDVLEWVKQAFEAISRAAAEESEVDRDVLDEIRTELDRADLAYGPLLAQAQSALAEREELLAQTTAEFETLRAEAHQLASGLADTQADLTGAQHRLESTVADATQLREALGERETALAETLARVNAAEAEIESLGTQLNQARAEVADATQLREALGERETTLTETLARVNATEAEIESLGVQLNQARAEVADATQLREALGERETALAETLARVNATEAEIEGLEVQLNEARAEVADATQLREALAEHETTLVETLARLETAVAETESLGAQLDQARTEQEGWLIEAETWLTEGEQLQATLTEREKLFAQRVQEHENLRAEARHLASALAATETKLAGAQHRLESTAADATRLGEALGKRETALVETLARVNAAEAEIESLGTQLGQERNEREASWREAEARRAEITRLKEELREQSVELERMIEVRSASGRRWRAFLHLLSWLARGKLRYVGRYFVLRRSFDYSAYLAANRDVAAAGLHPLLHYIEHGAREGRPLEPPYRAVGASSTSSRRARAFPQFASWLARGKLRYVWRYLVLRRTFGYDAYLTANHDVAAAGLHPLLHYIEHGAREGRALKPPPWEAAPQLTPAEIAAFLERSGFIDDDLQKRPADPAQPPSLQLLAAADEVRRRVQPAPEFEEFDPQIAASAPPRAKAIAFYLPQFHAIPENDEWWGKGFTEWTNVARGYPRFTGHYQPRVPRDLGFYNLEQEGVFERQVELARAAGIHGFSFHYYWFDGKRLLEKPLERFLADRSIDFPFCLTWANENWTRRWDGQDEELLMEQTYDPDRDADLIDDLQRHFDDDRYIRIGGRPLLLIYRLDIIPDPRETVDRWRRLWKLRHAEDPLILAAQSFWNTEDPRLYGLDGAIEFPPHRAALQCGILNSELHVLDPSFTAEVVSYAAAMEASLSGPQPDFPLVKTIIPSWDNDARREGQGLLVHGSTPELYEDWLRGLADIATAHPVGGESLVFINAWNEWAEGAYLEPDVHYGAAYLNATARALCAPRSVEKPTRADMLGRETGVAAEHTHAGDSGIVTAELRAKLEGEFDRDYYLARYQDIGEAGIDPLEHYVQTGWLEGRDPSSEFSTSYYLSANPDVAAAAVNPFVHFVLTGRNEGRLPRRAWGLRRETLENLSSVDEEIEGWREYHGPGAAPMNEASLTRLLVDLVGTRRHVVISCSHDDYTRVAGGVQLCVKLEHAAFDERDCAYLNLHPALPLPVLSRETEPEALTLAVVGDGEMLGAATAETILSALTHLGSEGVDFGLVVHHLRGHSPEVIAQLYDGLNPRWAWLWLHDFFAICPNPTLLRNTIEPCHAPPRESTGCMICVFGEERIRHIPRLRELLDRVPFKLVAPSQFMADRWKEYFGNDQLQVTVHEHGAVTRDATNTAERGLVRVPVDGPARVAFVGAPLFYKGWEVFLELVRKHAQSGEYRFYHFGDGSYRHPDVEPRAANVLENGPHAMIDALRADSIDVALMWSIVEESFGFTAHEAIAAGAVLVTNEGSGNVARVVKAASDGLLFGDEQELFEAFDTKSILDSVHSRRLTQQRDRSHFVHGNLTADLAHFDD